MNDLINSARAAIVSTAIVTASVAVPVLTILAAVA